jgi:hypothetical protein
MRTVLLGMPVIHIAQESSVLCKDMNALLVASINLYFGSIKIGQLPVTAI